MLKSFIQLNIHSQHDKSEYQIKKNKLVLLGNKHNKQQLIQSNLNKPLVSKVSFTKQSHSRQSTMITSSWMGNNNNNRINSVFKQQQSEVNFDCITYDYKSTNQKILYELLMINNNNNNNSKTFQKSHQLNGNDLAILTKTLEQLHIIDIHKNNNGTIIQPIRLAITFNYDIQYEKLQQLIIQLMEIKKFQQSKFQIAHFQLRNNHVMDYNKPKQNKQPVNINFKHHQDQINNNKFNNNRLSKQSDQSKHIKESDQMDQFTKQIDTCIKLDKAYNIKDNIKYKHFTREDFKTKDVLNKNSRTNYDKKTNQFFILNIDDQYEVDLIVLHRQKDYVLTKIEEKEIQEAFVLYKGSKERGTVKLDFTSSLAQILQSFLNQSHLVIFLSQYPTPNHYTLAEQLHMPTLLDPNQPSSVQAIIQQYNKQKESKLQIQMQKMKVKLRQIKHKKKTTQQNIGYLMRKYKKGFQNIFDSLNYLKKNNINDIKAYKDNLQIEIKQKQEEIRETLQQLKEINLDMIQSSERSEYFMGKMEELKETLQQDLEDIEVDYQAVGKHSKDNDKCIKVKGKQIMEQENKEQQKKIINNKPNNKSAESEKNKNDTLSVNQQRKKSLKSKNTNNTKLAVNNQPLPSSTEIVSSSVLKKLLDEQNALNPYEVQMQRQVQKYTNELREKTRERLMMSKQVEQFKNVMDELRKRVTKQQFTKLQQKYLALISMC